LTEARRRVLGDTKETLLWLVLGAGALAGALTLIYVAPRVERLWVAEAILLGVVLWSGVAAVSAFIRSRNRRRQANRGDVDVYERGAIARPALSDLLQRDRRSLGWQVALTLTFVTVEVAAFYVFGDDASRSPDMAWFYGGFLMITPLAVLLAYGKTSLSPTYSNLARLTGAYRLPIGGSSRATKALYQATIATGLHGPPPPLYVVPAPSVNAYVAGTPKRYTVGVTEGMLEDLDSEELVAVFANLLVRLEPGLVSGRGLTGGVIRSFRHEPEAEDMDTILDLYSGCDDASVLATRNPGALAEALQKQLASSASVPGLNQTHSAFLWHSPYDSYALARRRLELLVPVAGPI